MIYIEEMELVQIRRNEAVCTSLQVAETFKKQHSHVIRDIESLDCSDGFRQSNFGLSSYTSSQNKILPMYYLTKDGFTFLVMGYRGKKAAGFKEDYIRAFNLMEKRLQEKLTESWQLERKQGKLSRKAETDALKQLVEYAREQGSAHADMLYITYSKLVNSAVGITNREMATVQQLSDLSVIERIILRQVQEGIAAGMDYHDIYFACKERICMLKQVAYLG